MEEHLCEVLPPWNNQLGEARSLQRKPFPPATVRILSDYSQHKFAFVCSRQIKKVPREGTNVVFTRNELLICLWHPVLLHIHPNFPMTFDSNVISVLTRSDRNGNQIGDVLQYLAVAPSNWKFIWQRQNDVQLLREQSNLFRFSWCPLFAN